MKPHIKWDSSARIWTCTYSDLSPFSGGRQIFISGRGESSASAISDWQESMTQSGWLDERPDSFSVALKYTQRKRRSIIDRLRGK